ncbi:TAXI family TRAP transporter solute-binding subunit [Poseidonibacter sp.]|uniref:TAXI family TRAP transporter solute-binding subunit n=1 Tax=Poseidonibacter sp. TaxID=2321188 RepID=UPI003C7962B7
MKYKFLSISIPIILLVIASFYITAQFIQPSPKKEFTSATGSKDGQYYKTALLYKKILEDEKVKVNIVTSSGSMQNLQLLQDKKVDIAFVQNGIELNEKQKHLKAIGSIYYEPIWVFYKNKKYTIDYIVELTSKKISVGVEGSGTNHLALQILKDNGISKENSTLYSYDSSKSKKLLMNDKIDAMFVVGSANSKVIKELLEDSSINVFSFKRSKAYSRKYNYLESLSLYEGTIDLYRNIPYEDSNLLATTANLVINDSLSDELQRLLLRKLFTIHNKKGLFEKNDQFPNISNLTIPVSEEAQRYYTYGDTWLEKIFPYWIASNLDRLKILLIPLLTLLFPLFKGVLPLYRWSIRSKIYKWYDKIQGIDKIIDELNLVELKQNLEELEKLRKEIKNETKVPLSYMGEYYDLIMHLELLISQLNIKIASK